MQVSPFSPCCLVGPLYCPGSCPHGAGSLGPRLRGMASENVWAGRTQQPQLFLTRISIPKFQLCSVGSASDYRSLQQSDGPWYDSGWPDDIAWIELEFLASVHSSHFILTALKVCFGRWDFMGAWPETELLMTFVHRVFLAHKHEFRDVSMGHDFCVASFFNDVHILSFVFGWFSSFWFLTRCPADSTRMASVRSWFFKSVFLFSRHDFSSQCSCFTCIDLFKSRTLIFQDMIFR